MWRTTTRRPGGPRTEGGRRPGAADRDRFVVISHPYGAGGAQTKRWAVWRLSATGQLSAVGEEFTMGRAPWGRIAFTPDGKYLYVGNFLDKNFSILRVDGTDVVDTGKKLMLDGHPAAARMSPK